MSQSDSPRTSPPNASRGGQGASPSRRPKTQKKYVMISAVAERLEVHPQTIRLYEREGLITPTRSAGNTRLYDDRSIRRLETILNLTRELGVNLAGVEVILSMKERMEELQEEVARLSDELRQAASDRRAGVERHHALVQVVTGLPMCVTVPDPRTRKTSRPGGR